MADNTDPNPDTETTGEAADDQAMIDQAMAQAQASLNDLKSAADDDDDAAVGAAVDLPDLGGNDASESTDASGIELLGDVDLHVTVELGRTEMLVEDVLKLGEGSVVELDKLAGDPVDVYVNNRLVARGEVLVLNDNFCIRISEIVADLEEQAEAAAEQAAEA